MQEQAPTFELDTSGTIHNADGWRIGGDTFRNCAFDDLDPFTQGYVEALLKAADATPGVPHDRHLAFSDLAPETLARIVEDCAAMAAHFPHVSFIAEDGRRFWVARGKGFVAGYHFTGGELKAAFPPRTAHIGDDGKVYLRDAV